MERGKRMEDAALQPRIIRTQGIAAELDPKGDVSAHAIGVIRFIPTNIFGKDSPCALRDLSRCNHHIRCVCWSHNMTVI